jgi:hypothetical protein
MANSLSLPVVFGNLTGSGPLSNLDLDFNAIKSYLNPPDGFNNLSPMANIGDLIVGGISGAATVLPSGATNSVLTSTGVTSTLAWSSIVPNHTVDAASLKTVTTELSTTNKVDMIPLKCLGYGFYPLLRTNKNNVYWVTCSIGSASQYSGAQYINTENKALIGINSNLDGVGIIYIVQTYMADATSEGKEIYWLLIRMDKITKKFISCSLDSASPYESTNNVDLTFHHPFPMYNPETDDMVVVTFNREQLDVIEDRGWVGDYQERSPLQVINEDYMVDEDSRPEWPTTPMVVAVTIRNGKRKIIKQVVSQPDYVLCRSLKLKDGL